MKKFCMFLLPSAILLTVSDPVIEMWTKSFSEFKVQFSGGIDCFSIHADHEKFGKGTTKFRQTLMTTLIILTLNKLKFLGKILFISFIQ